VFFLMFLGLSLVVWVLGLIFVAPARRQAGPYTGLSLLLAFAGLALFTLLSWWSNIFPMRFGEGSLVTYSVSFPHDFLAQGALGIVVFAVGILGGISPALALWLVCRQSAKPSTAP
jgi:hypothetical protein